MTFQIVALSLILAAAPLPEDTLVTDTGRVVGVAVPATAVYTHGDMDFNRELSAADIILMVNKVFRGQELPISDGVVAVHITQVEIPADTMQPSDTTWVTFVPTYGARR